MKNGGRVVDIRPYFPADLGSRRHARQQVCCQVEDEAILVATLARDYVDFHFADRVVAEAVGNNKLVTNLQTKFEFRHYLDSLALFDQYRAKWWDKAHIPVADRRLLERTMQRHPDAVIRVDTPVQLRVMTKL
ncbi:MAG: hypothetical protein OXD39_14425 [Gemmatimonadetes bacterium]|nr:hypothetical protein [Gemmatimonadota bacterium]